MSQTLIDRSPDLQRLIQEGYDVSIEDSTLIIRDVPYVTERGEIKSADIFCPISPLVNDATRPPDSHVAYWTGSRPYHANGKPISAFDHSAPPTMVGNLHAQRTFSAMAAYRDYHHKMLTYIARMEAEAQVIDPNATARHFRLSIATESDSVFRYIDNASTRADLTVLNRVFNGTKIAIVGLGGTGSYVLDFVSKCEGVELHVYDRDTFYQHNAFRSPGAASREDLAAELEKVTYYKHIYERMRESIETHSYHIDESNVHELFSMSHVFLCIDDPVARKFISRSLVDHGTPFFDVGLGIANQDGKLGGLVRISSIISGYTPEALKQLPIAERVDEENLYRRNAQVVELNALNAALAVIAWKKMLGYYRSSAPAYYTGYSIASGEITNE